MSESMTEFLRRKAGEPSTWKGVGWLLFAAGLVPAGAVEAIGSLGLAVVGLVEIIRREKP